MKVVRLGVSIEQDVLQLLDDFVVDNQFPNRSQGIRHLIQRMEVEKQWESNELVAGSITLLFEHQRLDVLNKIRNIQHDFNHVILCSQQVNVDHNSCMEIIALKGYAYVLNELTNLLQATKGVISSGISMSRFL